MIQGKEEANAYTNNVQAMQQILSQEIPKSGGIITNNNSFSAGEHKRVNTATNNMVFQRHTEIGGATEDYRSKMVYTANVMMGRKRRGQSVIENVNEESGSK